VYPFLQPICDITAMMAAATSITIFLGVHEVTKRQGNLSWQESHDQPHSLISTRKCGWDRRWDGFFGDRKLNQVASTTGTWHLQSNLPLHYQITVSWTMWSPVAQARSHVEFWKFDFKVFCRRCGEWCT